MRKDLLTIGANLLRSDAANPTGVKFDLGTWIERGDVEHVATGAVEAKWTEATLPEAIPVSCGTKACAFGLMAISGAFKEQGLGYKTSQTGQYREDCVVALVPILDIGLGENNPTAFEAAARLFEISKTDAGYFFDPCCYAETPTGAQGEIEVAERIESFMNGVIDKRRHPDTRHDYDDDYDDDED